MGQRPATNESGVALLLTLFIIALATILIAELTQTSQYDQRAFRSLSEGIQAEYGLKSALNSALAVLKMPNDPAAGDATWQGEAWYQLSSEGTLPMDGINGTVRVQIADEFGKLPLNALVSTSSGSQTPSGGGGVPLPGTHPAASRLRSALRDLMLAIGFPANKQQTTPGRTFGNVEFGAADQVAAIVDWIDTDSVPLNDPNFDGQGVEGRSLDKRLFPGRQLRRIQDLLLVPGMTLERLGKLAPYVNTAKVFAAAASVNVNTASPEVLQALLSESEDVVKITRLRTSTRDFGTLRTTISEIEQKDPTLRGKLKTTSSRFSIYARVEMPSVTRWLYAEVSTAGGGRRNIQYEDRIVEFY